jgi:hypothetical protein
MRYVLLRSRIAVFCRASLLLAVAVVSSAIDLTQAVASPEADSLAAWDKIAGVLRHPRCLNCHQLNTPLQGDGRRVHIPPVMRGVDSLGTATMRRRNCHNETGNNEMSGVPGAPHWQLAPASMLWEGLSTGDLCRMLKNPKLNGNRTPDALVEHMDTDKLVLWGWQPGGRRAPVPISHKEFVDLLKVWVFGGTACPQ